MTASKSPRKRIGIQLMRGMVNSPLVERLQRRLMGLGYLPLNLPSIGGMGTFGPRTELAVLCFQWLAKDAFPQLKANRQFKFDGIVGDMTWTAMNDAKAPPWPWEPIRRRGDPVTPDRIPNAEEWAAMQAVPIPIPNPDQPQPKLQPIEVHSTINCHPTPTGPPAPPPGREHLQQFYEWVMRRVNSLGGGSG